MRGGVSANDLFDRYGIEDIELMNDIIKENIETTKNTQMPII